MPVFTRSSSQPLAALTTILLSGGYNSSMNPRIGNVLHQLRAYVHPHVKHVITQTLEHDALQEEPGDPQQLHIKSQAVRIQRGEQLDQVTALLPNGK
jgi:hypothetical protein